MIPHVQCEQEGEDDEEVLPVEADAEQRRNDAAVRAGRERDKMKDSTPKEEILR